MLTHHRPPNNFWLRLIFPLAQRPPDTLHRLLRYFWWCFCRFGSFFIAVCCCLYCACCWSFGCAGCQGCVTDHYDWVVCCCCFCRRWGWIGCCFCCCRWIGCCFAKSSPNPPQQLPVRGRRHLILLILMTITTALMTITMRMMLMTITRIIRRRIKYDLWSMSHVKGCPNPPVTEIIIRLVIVT